MEEVVVTQSNKGGKKKFHCGFSFVKQKILANSIVSYECCKRKTGSYKAKQRLDKDDNLIYICGEHNHAISNGEREVIEIRRQIKIRAQTTTGTTSNIVAVSLKDSSPVIDAQFVT